MMSPFFTGNIFLGLSILMATVSQVILKALVSELDPAAGFGEKLRQLLVASRFWRAGIAGTLIVAGFICWVVCLTKLDLSYAYPVACGSALLVTLMCVIFLGEPVTTKVWIGTILIMLGTILLAPGSPGPVS